VFPRLVTFRSWQETLANSFAKRCKEKKGSPPDSMRTLQSCIVFFVHKHYHCVPNPTDVQTSRRTGMRLRVARHLIQFTPYIRASSSLYIDKRSRIASSLQKKTNVCRSECVTSNASRPSSFASRCRQGVDCCTQRRSPCESQDNGWMS
jgi:hypothetical protein